MLHTKEKPMEAIGGLIMLVTLGVLYFVPLVVALGREHHQCLAIGMVNVLFGWTVLGWGVALIWACTAVRPPTTPQP
jgi:hypothetical protein